MTLFYCFLYFCIYLFDYWVISFVSFVNFFIVFIDWEFFSQYILISNDRKWQFAKQILEEGSFLLLITGGLQQQRTLLWLAWYYIVHVIRKETYKKTKSAQIFFVIWSLSFFLRSSSWSGRCHSSSGLVVIWSLSFFLRSCRDLVAIILPQVFLVIWSLSFFLRSCRDLVAIITSQVFLMNWSLSFFFRSSSWSGSYPLPRVLLMYWSVSFIIRSSSWSGRYRSSWGLLREPVSTLQFSNAPPMCTRNKSDIFISGIRSLSTLICIPLSPPLSCVQRDKACG